MKHGFLIDMDGVLYRGSQLIPGANTFIDHLRQCDIPFWFLTNNSQRTRRDIVAKLSRMGIDVEEEHVYTCAMATTTEVGGAHGLAYASKAVCDRIVFGTSFHLQWRKEPPCHLRTRGKRCTGTDVLRLSSS